MNETQRGILYTKAARSVTGRQPRYTGRPSGGRAGGRERRRTYLDDVFVGAALVRLVVLGVLEQHLVHVGAGVLEELVAAVEDDERDLAVAQHAQLVRLLHQPELALRERHLRTRVTNSDVSQTI